MKENKRFLPGEVKELRVLGRTAANRSPLVLFWTGSGIELNYEGTELWCEFETDYSCFEQWIAVFINGALISRQMLQKGRQRVCLLRNMQQQKVNHVRVVKEVQAMPGDEEAYLAIHALYGDGRLHELREPECRIEFIGDSITSGEGSYGSVEEQDWISMWFSATHAYPQLVAERLRAEYRVFSQSGYGVFCGWDNHPDHAIPLYYGQVCGVLSGARNAALGAKDCHDFSTWQPDYIVINLGTNDGAAFDQPEWRDEVSGLTNKMYRNADKTPAEECLKKVQRAVTEFLELVREKNPKAELFWGYGMLGKLMEPAIQAGIADYRARSADERVHYIALEEIRAEQSGARNHPGICGHRAVAERIYQAIAELRR